MDINWYQQFGNTLNLWILQSIHYELSKRFVWANGGQDRVKFWENMVTKGLVVRGLLSVSPRLCEKEGRRKSQGSQAGAEKTMVQGSSPCCSNGLSPPVCIEKEGNHDHSRRNTERKLPWTSALVKCVGFCCCLFYFVWHVDGGMCCLHVCLCTACVPAVHQDWKRA